MSSVGVHARRPLRPASLSAFPSRASPIYSTFPIHPYPSTMPLPAFMSRKGSSASRKSTAGSAAGGGGGNSGVITEGTTAAGGGDHSEGGSSNSSTKPRLTIPGLGLGRSSSKSQNVSRSPSLYSFRGGGGGNGDRCAFHHALRRPSVSLMTHIAHTCTHTHTEDRQLLLHRMSYRTRPS